jgi:hypothetical protein
MPKKREISGTPALYIVGGCRVGLTFAMSRGAHLVIGAVGSIAMLATHFRDCSSANARQSSLDVWQQRAQIVDVVARCLHQNDADVQTGEVLLIGDALIHSEQRVEFPTRKAE